MARYELVDDKSSKFWDIVLTGSSFTTTYGKIGTEGTTTLKEWPSDAVAKKEHDKLVAEKVKKGYKPVDGAATAAPQGKPAPKPEPEESDDEEDADEEEATPKAAAKTGARRFELSDGSSN